MGDMWPAPGMGEQSAANHGCPVSWPWEFLLGDNGSACSRSSLSNGTFPVLSRQLWFPGSLSPT